MRRDFDLEEFADVWPSCDPAPREVGVGVWKAPPLQGKELPGELSEALEALPAGLRKPALEAWVGAKSRGLKVERVECPKC